MPRRLAWALALVALAGCGRTGLSLPSDDDGVEATGATGDSPSTGGSTSAGGSTNTGGAPNGGAGGRAGAGGGSGFVGFGGTPDGSGSGGGAGAANETTCAIRVLPFAGDDANDGTSWDRAVTSLTRALALAHSGCEVWLASGTYLPTNDSDRRATFTVPAGVAIRGGFDGTERTPADRRFAELLPLLSGNIGDTGTDDDVYHVVTALGAATLDHVYLTHGHAPVGSGGGAILAAGDLTLDTCNVYKSVSDGNGGGVWARGALTVKSSTFTELTASRNGGAIVADGTAALTFDNALFDENAASDGGAVYVGTTHGDASVTVTNSSFTRNIATGAGASTANGGAISFHGGALSLSGSTLLDNTALAGKGGAVYSDGDATVVSTLVARNSADDGAALAQGAPGTLALVNVTVAENGAVARAAIDVEAGGSIQIANSVFWSDHPAEIVLAGAPLTSEDPATRNLFASNLKGTYPNLSLFDPRFADAKNEDYQLKSSSPCIDHGDDSRAPSTDLRGHPRVGPADMGAYEYGN